MAKVKWGVLSTARIGVEKVIPAMQKGNNSEVVAIASRNHAKAVATGEKLRIPKRYGSYEELLTDKEIEAIYISLPNHLHVEWSIKCLQAGKHVLCEKPIGINLQQALQLQSAAKQYPHLKVMEAFMYRFHPRWKTIRTLIDDGIIGDMRYVHSMFSYYNVNPVDVRNQKDIGGGGLLDIGCYCISLARFLFRSEPTSVKSQIEYDPILKIDRLTSGILEFADGRSTFTCSTQLHPHQHATIIGTKGKIEIEYPFNPPQGTATKILYSTGSGERTIEFPPVDLYMLQGESFAAAILERREVPTPLTDAVENMKVITTMIKNSVSLP